MSLSNTNQIDIDDCSYYDLKKYIQPYWEGTIIYNESVLPIRNKNETILTIPLLYKAEKIISVRSASLSVLYEYGKDYILENGNLIIQNGSSIEALDYNQYYPEFPISGFTFLKKGGGNLFFSEGDFFHKHQFAVTYIHSQKWTGKKPKTQTSMLPKTITKLKSKEEIQVLFYGDSITTGANSSSCINVAPFAPSYCTMFVDGLKYKYDYNNIIEINTAVGGTISNWGADNAKERAALKKPDLAIIAFGMNDVAVPPSIYQTNIKSIIDSILIENPNCEFVLVNTMLPNSEAEEFMGNQSKFGEVLMELVKEGIAVADVQSIHIELLKTKRYGDMTGNNINHPNDFLARAYAQTLLSIFM